MAGLVARRLGDDFDEDYWQRLERMFSFVAGRCETNSPCPSPATVTSRVCWILAARTMR